MPVVRRQWLIRRAGPEPNNPQRITGGRTPPSWLGSLAQLLQAVEPIAARHRENVAVVDLHGGFHVRERLGQELLPLESETAEVVGLGALGFKSSERLKSARA